MTEPSRRTRMLLTTILLLLLGILILQALGYGIGFFLDPESGLGEFASPPPAERNDLTVALVGLVGVGMLGAAVLLALAGALLLRGESAGSYVAIAMGVVYVLAGFSALRSSWAWDAYFYVGSGALLVGLSIAVRWLRPVGRAPE